MFQQQQQETSVAQLLSVIQKLQSGKMSGTLTVRRGNKASYEEGAVTFVQGQAIQAQAQRRNGSEAFNWLSTWGTCQYTFVSTDGFPQANLALTPPPSTPIPNRANTNTGPIIQDFSSYAFLVPYRSRQAEEALAIIEYRGLGRIHRHAFLLIDGQRTIHELVRFLKRDERGVYDLLRDLERVGLIKITPENQST